MTISYSMTPAKKAGRDVIEMEAVVQMDSMIDWFGQHFQTCTVLYSRLRKLVRDGYFVCLLSWYGTLFGISW